MGCGDPAAPSEPLPVPRIEFRSGPAGDTIDRRLTEPLVLRVVPPEGTPRAGHVVRLSALWGLEHQRGEQRATILLDQSNNIWLDRLVLTSDSVGDVRSRLMMGPVSGRGGVVATVPALGLVDTVFIDIRPGRAVALRMEPSDTAILIGASYRFQVHARDRRWNPRPDSVNVSSGAGAELRDGTVRGLEHARVPLSVAAGSLRDTAWVSIVPRATLAAVRQPTSSDDTAGVVVFQTDGRDYRYLSFEIGEGYWKVDLSWIPPGDRVVYNGPGHDPFFFIANLEGQVAQLPLQQAIPGGHYVPDVSPDGRWIYFAGQPTHQDQALYRVPVAGGAIEQIGPAGGFHDVDTAPAVSPDGATVVYQTNRVDYNVSRLRILDVQSRTISPLDVPGVIGRWSPDGSRIAFLRDGGIHLMTAGGTYLRQVTTGNEYDRLDWSPDGAWFVGSRRTTFAGAGIDLVRESDGLRLPLPFASKLESARFRR
jgi:hypothetical protein